METNPTLQVATFAGGLALLIYGMRISGRGLEQMAGPRMRTWLHRLTQRRLAGAGVGAALTALMQSSSATSVLLVSLTSAGLLPFGQTIAVLLGAGVGSTLTVHLIAFNVLDWAPLILALGVALIMATRHPAYVYLGRAIFGFGLLFMGMWLLVRAMAPLRGSETFADLLSDLTGAPILLLLISLIFTALVQSSAATIGVAIGLALNGAIGLDAALPLMLGANIGTTATGLIASVGSGVESRRVAVSHVMLKLVGAAIVFPLLGLIGPLIAATAPDVPRQIANSHTFFNLALLIVFLPVAVPAAWLIRRVVPEPRREPDRVEAYLDPITLESPAVAIGQATRAVLRMGEIVQAMLRDAQRAMETNDESLVLDVRERDDQVDQLQRTIRTYLTALATNERLSADESVREIGLLYAVNDLENIGDVLDKNLAELALKKIHGRHAFSPEGAADLREFHDIVSTELGRALSSFASGDAELAADVIALKSRVSDLERDMRRRHIQRLYAGRAESIDTSDIHLDVLINLKRINTHATNLAYVVTERN